jgi:hypothetical protein
MNFQINIPVKPFVKSYYESVYGTPVYASIRNVVGIIIDPFLQKAPQQIEFPKYETELLITLTWLHYPSDMKDPKMYNYITPQNAKILGKLFEKLFWNIYYTHMDAGKEANNKIKIKNMIEGFMIRYNIDPMYGSFEMFSKKYYRYKNNSAKCLNKKVS